MKRPQTQCFLIFILGMLLISFTKEANGDDGVIKGTVGVLVVVIANTLTSMLYAWPLARHDASYTFKDHTMRAILRGLILSIFPVIMIYLTGKSAYLVLIFHNCTIFYFFFDLIYNHYRGNHWSYVGTTSKVDIVIRQINTIPFFKRHSVEWYMLFKLSLVISSLYLIHKYLHI